MTRRSPSRRSLAIARYQGLVLHVHDGAASRRWYQPGPLAHARKQGRRNAQARAGQSSPDN